MRSRRPRCVRVRYTALWDELHFEPELSPDDRHAVRARIRRLNDLGFAVDEISLEPTSGGEAVRLRVAVASRRFHARELQRLTGLVALEGQARLLLNDLREHQAWLELTGGSPVAPEVAADIWMRDVLQPSLAILAPAIGPGRDPLQAYCDVLEEKWLLSEAAGQDVGSRASPCRPTSSSVPRRPRSPAPTAPSRSTSTGPGVRQRPGVGADVCGRPLEPSRCHGCTPRERSRPVRSSGSGG